MGRIGGVGTREEVGELIVEMEVSPDGEGLEEEGVEEGAREELVGDGFEGADGEDGTGGVGEEGEGVG